MYHQLVWGGDGIFIFIHFQDLGNSGKANICCPPLIAFMASQLKLLQSSEERNLCSSQVVEVTGLEVLSAKLAHETAVHFVDSILNFYTQYLVMIIQGDGLGAN